MKIAYITAGAAGMYCGSCMHDNTLARALIALGHDVSLIPTYTPIRTDEEDVSIDRVFYGAINVYLEQKSSLFRHTPWLLDRLLTNRKLLNWASGFRSSTDARDLGALTLSVLQGEHGHQKKELERLVGWLRDDLHPEVVHLTNSMFLGMAKRIRHELNVPVVCSVQGEDLFLDDLIEPYRQQVLQAVRERTGDVTAFVATSAYYAAYMAEYLDLDPQRIEKVDLGIDVTSFDADPARRSGEPFVVGYLARLCPEKGLHLAVEAFRRLAEERGRERVRLRIAGFLDGKDRGYVDGLMRQIDGWGLAAYVEHAGEVDHRGKVEFLRGIDVLTVPTTYREPKGLFVLEALACGVPVVQPRHGAFPEMIERTGGGLLVEPDSAAELASALGQLMDDPGKREQLGRRGREVVRGEYNERLMAERTIQLYRKFVKG
jgi:glycosyltransferase involved in cell wall biosynthesis